MRERTRRRRGLGTMLLALAVLAACGATGDADGGASGTGAGTASGAPTSTAARAAAASTGCASGAPTAGRRTDLVLDVDGTARTYDLTVPDAPAAADEPAPLVVALHGFAGDAGGFEVLTGIGERGAAQGAVVVVPDGAGTPPTWAVPGDGSDEAFLEALVDHVGATTCVDLDRVVLTGFSAGAAMAIRHACSHEDQVAAIATVAVEFALGCTRPTTILAIHGTADEAVPYQDGAIGLSLPGVPVRGTEQNIGDWAELAGCDGHEVTEVTTGVDRWDHLGCTDGTEVVLYVVHDVGHVWPGAAPEGEGRSELDATGLVLELVADLPG